ncbi:CitMHS family transporter [Phenylobacterium sp.]|uniref:CitMHS family transporter n=1 Tax=Phenylobacterium sp. TaxID=1871053 RepID=UPI0025E77A04|nr:citrate:proton symporter [Phenylobacterium sp.]MBX3482242.1 citrate:proton symporter [Phenylobacterium sp.]
MPALLTHPAVLGAAMVATFMTLIMTRRMSAVAALLAVPIAFGLLAGEGAGLGRMILEGVGQVAPTALFLGFAVLYFALMMDAGLFAPLVRGVLRVVGRDPLRISLGTAVLATLVSLNGDGTSTALIVITAFLPVYRRVGMNPLILATLLGLSSSLVNLLPWGGPAARAAAALHLDLADVVGPILPAMLAGLAVVFLLAWLFGRAERRRLGWVPGAPDAVTTPLQPEAEDDARRPKLLGFNLALTLALLAGMISGLAPLPVLMMGAFAIALTVNYPRLADQRARFAAHADNVLQVFLLIFAAGVFTGILNGAGMADAMATAVLSVVPPEVGPSMAPIAGLAALPLSFVMSNDAYYFGVVPVVAKAAAAFGVEPVAIARAAMVGLPVHTLSPLLAPIYLACSLLEVDVGEAQRFALKWAVLVSLVLLIVMGLTGAIPWRA